MSKRVNGSVLSGLPLLVLLLLVLTTSCGRGGNWTLPDDEHLLKLTASYDTLPFTYYFSHIDYVTLETSEESLIYVVDKVIAGDSLIYLLDEMTRSILLFSAEGRFIARYVDLYGRRLNDFDVAGCGAVFALLNNRILVELDKDLNLLSEARVPFLANSLIALSSDRVLFYTDFFPGSQTEQGEESDLIIYNTRGGRVTPVLNTSPRAPVASLQFGRQLYRSDKLIFSNPLTSELLYFTETGFSGVKRVDFTEIAGRDSGIISHYYWTDAAYVKGNLLRIEASAVTDDGFVGADLLYDFEEERMVTALKKDYDGFFGLLPVRGVFPGGFISAVHTDYINRNSRRLGRPAPSPLDNLEPGSNPVLLFYHLK